MMIGLEGAYDSQILQNLPQYCPSCPSSMVLALVQAESSGNQFQNNGQLVTSPAGAIGLFQLMPQTAAGLNVDPTNPAQNIQGGEQLLQQLYNQYGDWNLALMAYNEGPGNLNKQLQAGVTPTSTGYAAGILQAAGVDPAATDSADPGTGDTADTSGGSSAGAWLAIAALAAAGLLFSQA